MKTIQMPKELSKNIKLSLYINGRYCENNAVHMPFVRTDSTSECVMVPLTQVVAELGLQVSHNEALGIYHIFSQNKFEPDILSVRYLKWSDGTLRLCFYMCRGEVFSLPNIQWLEKEAYVPLELFSKALDCACAVSDRGNINIRRDKELRK